MVKLRQEIERREKDKAELQKEKEEKNKKEEQNEKKRGGEDFITLDQAFKAARRLWKGMVA